MISNQTDSNPFALLMNPDAVFQALERSDRLSRLQSRICRPLDKPLIPRAASDLSAFDHDIDAAPDLIDDSENLED